MMTTMFPTPVNNKSSGLSDFTTNGVTTNVTNDADTDRSSQHAAPPSELNKAATILMVYFLPVIFLSGILGNSMSFLVFLSEKMRRVSTNVYLAALSATNGVFLLAVGVSWTDMVGWKLMHMEGLCQATVYLTYCSGFVSVWLVVCITVENFVINFFLHKASWLCTIRRALSLVLLLNVIAFLFYDFAIWTTGIVSDRIGNNNNDDDASNSTDNITGGRFPSYCQTYPQYQGVVEIFTLLDVSLTSVLPSVVILALVIPTCARNVSCKARNAPPLNSTVLSRRERALLRVTRLLCVIIVSHVLLTAPSHLFKLRHLLLKASGVGSESSPTTEMIVVFMVQLLYFLSFSVNFIYFLIWGKNFRDRFCFLASGLYRVLRRCKRKLCHERMGL